MGQVNETLALVTLEEMKEYLRIERDTEDSILGSLINAASEFANAFTGRKLLLTSYTEYYDGEGQKELFLKNYPVVTFTSMKDDPDRLFAASSAMATSDYLVDKAAGVVRLLFVRFMSGIANVKVEYTAGYALDGVPEDLRLAVKKLVALEYQAKYLEPSRQGVKQISQGDRTTTFIEDAVPKDIINLLMRYRSAGWAARASA